MNLKKLSVLAEDLRRAVIGNPIWVEEKHAYHYENRAIEVIVILKLLRAIQGVMAQVLLCESGLFIDMSAIFRCVADCSDEICFLLENYPEKSKDVQQFVEHFFESKILPNDDVRIHSVPKKKILKAKARMFSKYREPKDTSSLLRSIHKTFSGYIHANYENIMQYCEGDSSIHKINTLLTSSNNQKMVQFQVVKLSYGSILLTMMLACRIFDQENIYVAVEELLETENF